jgi:beta-mannosidase
MEKAGNQMQELNSSTFADGRDPHQWLYAAVLVSEQAEALDQSIWLLLPHRELALASPDIQVTQPADGWIQVSSPVYCHAVHCEDHGHAVLSDNWFDLLPGVPIRLKMEQSIHLDDIKLTAVTSIPL